MSIKTTKILFWVFTGLLSLMMLLSASMYLFNNAEIQIVFESLGFPSYIIYPLATLKLLGILAITTRKFKSLTEWAYAGFFFDFILASSAHYFAGDGDEIGGILALILLFGSYYFGKKLK